MSQRIRSVLTAAEARDLALAFSQDGTPPSAFDAWERVRARWWPEMGLTQKSKSGTSLTATYAYVLLKIAKALDDE